MLEREYRAHGSAPWMMNERTETERDAGWFFREKRSLGWLRDLRTCYVTRTRTMTDVDDNEKRRTTSDRERGEQRARTKARGEKTVVSKRAWLAASPASSLAPSSWLFSLGWFCAEKLPTRRRDPSFAGREGADSFDSFLSPILRAHKFRPPPLGVCFRGILASLVSLLFLRLIHIYPLWNHLFPTYNRWIFFCGEKLPRGRLFESHGVLILFRFFPRLFSALFPSHLSLNWDFATCGISSLGRSAH